MRRFFQGGRAFGGLADFHGGRGSGSLADFLAEVHTLRTPQALPNPSLPALPSRATRLFLVSLLLGSLLGCTGDGREDRGEIEAASREPVALGPVDGQGLPPTDIERVAVGTVAPDFSLETLAGDTLTLSAFRGLKNVVLVFYRGHW
jgi:hypothetical protein